MSKKKTEETKAEELPQEIVPIAYAVRLKSIHPRASYGRCGYRFNKLNDVEIAVSALTSAQVLRLIEDPYLDVVPVTE